MGQQREVIGHQQDQLIHQLTTINADRAARTPVIPIAQEARGNLVDLRVGNKLETFTGEVHERKGWSIKMRQYISAVDEELYVGHVDVEANPLRELRMSGTNEPQKKRARQLAFMMTMHTKDRALQMITKLSDPTNEFEIWRRFLEEWEPAHRGRYRAMLMQLLQFPFTGDRGQALEEWERLVRQCEAQSSDTLQDTIKAAILAHNPQDPERRRHVGLNATQGTMLSESSGKQYTKRTDSGAWQTGTRPHQWKLTRSRRARRKARAKRRAKRKAEQRAKTSRRKERQTSRA